MEQNKLDDLYRLRHSLAHIMAQAVLQIRPKAKLAFGPPIENGFYYDFDLETPLTPEDFQEIEKRMRKIIAEDQPFESFSRSASDAVTFLESIGENYKAEYCRELTSKGETQIGFYKNGPFEDMCRGPHVVSTRNIPPDCFKVDSIAGAYWRGDEKRPQLTRLYGLAFENKKSLEDFLEKRRLAKERDHRKLGSELELFTIEDRVGPGLPLWLPNGTVIKDELETFAKETEFRWGYQRISTPHITKENLYYTSGHLPYYKETMFPPMQLEDEEPYYLKPMNCPHHHMVFGHRPRSYRELPLRFAEYGVVYRYEESGALSGLLRVRMISQNDAHIYCSKEQAKEEFRAVLDLHSFYYQKLRINDYVLRLSLHDPNKKEKYIDNAEGWAFTEQAIKEVLLEMGVPFIEGIGEGAFYGPKVDYQLRNVIGREETASTNQLDFASADRFNLTYIAEDGKPHRPYIIHRAPLGSHERFIGFLIEHYGGAFPTWLAPVQAVIIPISDKFNDYAEMVRKSLQEKLVRTELDYGSESFNKKIRTHTTRKVPNILIIGGKEAETETVTWRRYCVKEQRTLKLSEFQALIAKMISARVMDNYPDEALPE